MMLGVFPSLVLLMPAAVKTTPRVAMEQPWAVRTSLGTPTELPFIEDARRRVVVLAANSGFARQIEIEKYSYADATPCEQLNDPPWRSEPGLLDIFVLEPPAQTHERVGFAAKASPSDAHEKMRRASTLVYLDSSYPNPSLCGRVAAPSWSAPLSAVKFLQQTDVTRRASLLLATKLVLNNDGYGCLHKNFGVLGFADIYEFDGVWAIARQKTSPNKFLDDGFMQPYLAYPLFETTGAVRTQDASRSGPFSAGIISPEFDPRVGPTSLLLVPRPLDPQAPMATPAPEYFCVLESMAEWNPPVLGVYKAPTWEPFREDFVIRMGIPDSTIGLRAVAFFSTIGDEDLGKLIKIIGEKTAPVEDEQVRPAAGKE